MIISFVILGHSHNDAPAGDVDSGHGLARERQQDAVAIRAADLDHIAGAVIMDGGDLAQDAAFAVLRFQADQVGCHIITVTHDVLAKLPLVGKDLDQYSLETVETFYRDAQAAGYAIDTRQPEPQRGAAEA